MKEFPLILEVEEAKDLIKASGYHLRESLIKEQGWGHRIAMDQTIYLDEGLYRTMRNSPTPSLQTALDKIFGQEVEDKNAFQDARLTDIIDFSTKIFGDPHAMQIGRSAVMGVGRHDLVGRSFYVNHRFEVVTHETLAGGTVIEIVKK
jgi:hypothetical protein